MKSTFEFNEHGVCVNAEIMFHVEHSGAKIELEVAERDGKWYYGYSFFSPKRGGSTTPCLSNGKGYTNKREATIAGGAVMWEHIGKHPLKKEFLKWFGDFRQLNLPL